MSTNPFSAQVIQGKFICGRPQFHAPGTKPGVAPLARRGHALEVPQAFKLSSHGPGKPMPPAVQAKMEAAFGASFADVRIHTGPQAQQLGAHAFTMGSNLYFAPGQHNPMSTHGQRLLGHELAHVVQQRAGRVRNPFGGGLVVVQDWVLEAEAERMGAWAAQPGGIVQSKPGAEAQQDEVAQRAIAAGILGVSIVGGLVGAWWYNRGGSSRSSNNSRILFRMPLR